MTEIAVFDGHNDLLSCLWHEQDLTGASFFAGRAGMVDLAKARAGGLAGGFFAIWAPSDPANSPDPMALARHYPAVEVEGAWAATLGQAAIFARMAAARPDAFRACLSVADIRAAHAEGAVAAILHLEGADGIDPGLERLHHLHGLGLRSLGPVWSRPTIFGHGVPFLFPHSPDTGPGLTAEGIRLVQECDSLGILVDLAHLNESGFWDVAKHSRKPLISTHSAAHALCPSTRNLTDRQLDAMAETGGLVGLNFGCGFLRADGVKNPDTAPETLIRHLDHLMRRLGEGGVALGSDFDGTTVPLFLKDAAGLPRLIAAMRQAGWGEALIARLAFGNWLDVLGRVIG